MQLYTDTHLYVFSLALALPLIINSIHCHLRHNIVTSPSLGSRLFLLEINNKIVSDGTPDPDSVLKETVRTKIRHRNIYLNHTVPITFIPLVTVVDTSDRLYDDFNRLLFLHTHREVSALSNELPEESDRERIGRGFLSPSTFHLGLSYHCLVSSILVSPHRF